MRLSEVAEALGAELRRVGEDANVGGVASPLTAGPGSLVFADHEESLAPALASQALAVIVAPKLAAGTLGKSLLISAQPRLAFAQAARLLRLPAIVSGVHPAAVVHPSAHLGAQVSVGACAVIGADAQIGPGTVIDAAVVLGDSVRVGAHCHLYPRVVAYSGTVLGDRVVVHAGAVLGSDGFGYVRDANTGRYVQFPQQGRLVIEDDVEIGANTTIDRGALEETRIERGVKIDNLVHLGHNVLVGHDVVIAAQTGVSGSSSIGANAVVGGQVGIGDHATVGEEVILGSGSGVLTHKRVRGRGVVFWGRPARPLHQYLKELAVLARLTRASSPKED
ncbi:MAG TPA: UDP-3-O-(3-hydroxymyristoyl)glucosamine N-acyltransferase [Acidobacteriaceae bacterium]|jgi:UDP-3-O-[3-hydroxymyristoyl] glucosamine N-acyltransferase